MPCRSGQRTRTSCPCGPTGCLHHGKTPEWVQTTTHEHSQRQRLRGSKVQQPRVTAKPRHKVNEADDQYTGPSLSPMAKLLVEASWLRMSASMPSCARKQGNTRRDRMRASALKETVREIQQDGARRRSGQDKCWHDEGETSTHQGGVLSAKRAVRQLELNVGEIEAGLEKRRDSQ